MASKGHVSSPPPSTEEPTTTKSFDTITSLAGLYLWLLFGFFTSLLGCDLQRLMTKNIYVKHIMALITFFFLMSVVDKDNNIGVGKTWLKTFVVYLLFMISIKNKIGAAALILILLIVDQTIKVQMDYQDRNKITNNMDLYKQIRQFIFYAVIFVAVIGYFLYYLHQRADYGADFSHLKLFFGTNKCEDL